MIDLGLPLAVPVGVAFVFGLLLGSFLNVCTLRWPVDQSVVRPRSRCPGCEQLIAWYDNVPILSWIVLRGRCRRCGRGISIQYPLVELATGLVWGGMALLYGLGMGAPGAAAASVGSAAQGLEAYVPAIEAFRGAVFLTLLLGIAVADARFYIIPDQFSIGGAVIGLALAPIAPIGILPAVYGAALGFGLLWFVAWAGEKAFKKEAMGGGDIKMMAMIGAFLGMSGVLLTIFLGAFLGAVIFGPISVKTGKLVPFGIFLAAGAAVAYGWGDAIVGWYMAWAFGV